MLGFVTVIFGHRFHATYICTCFVVLTGPENAFFKDPHSIFGGGALRAGLPEHGRPARRLW